MASPVALQALQSLLKTDAFTYKTVYEDAAILAFILISAFLKNAEIISDLDFITPN